MAERLIAAILKIAGGLRLPGVQIPLPPPCVAPQGPRTSWARLEQQARYPFPSLRMSGGCHVTLRAASIGEAAFLFPSAPAPRGEQAKAADSLPKRDRKAAHRAVPVTTKEVTGIESCWREDLFPEKVSLPSAFPLSLTLRPTAVPDRCRAGRLRDRRPGGRGRLRQRPCR